MRTTKFRPLILVGFLLAMAIPALAANRIIVYSGQNPTSLEANQGPRFQRLADGTFLRDLIGSKLATSGAYSNLTITPGSGLNVTVNPTQSSQLGALYQMAQDDPNPIPTSAPSLPSDPTQIIVQATQAINTSPIGPLTAPSGPSNSVYYLIEAQVLTSDGNPLPMLFINGNGTTLYNNVNTWRSDSIVYQAVEGAPDPSPSPPPVDSGWVNMGTVIVAHGATQVHSGDITMNGGTALPRQYGLANVLCSDSTTGEVAACQSGDNWPYDNGGMPITVEIVGGGCANGTVCQCKHVPDGSESPCDSDSYYSHTPHNGCFLSNAATGPGDPAFGLIAFNGNESGGSNPGGHIYWFNGTGSNITGGTDIGAYINCIKG